MSHRRFKLGDRVTKVKGSNWTGHVVGFYSTTLTPVGYCVESETETGSVQIYPQAALSFADIAKAFDDRSTKWGNPFVVGQSGGAYPSLGEGK